MRINVNSIDETNFSARPCVVAETPCVLVNPINIGAKWTKDTMLFRSSIWTLEGYPVSLSFQKFFNFAEHPELCPTPSSMKGVEMIEKLDGSTLVFSLYKGELIARTRGTVSATSMENGHEIPLLLAKYPLVENYLRMNAVEGTAPFTLIFEWTTPTNRIVIDYGSEPNMHLIARVSHEDYSLSTQNQLDDLAKKLEVPRPRRFKFDTFEHAFAAIKAMDYEKTREFGAPQQYASELPCDESLVDNFEGFCVYFGNGQYIRKVKGARYLYLHKMKSELSSFDKVLDLWVTKDATSFTEFYEYVAKALDYEIANSARNDIAKVADAHKEVMNIIAGMERFVEGLRGIAGKVGFAKARKAQAEKIFEAYGQTNRASFVFSLLDSKPLNSDQRKKLFWQVLK